MKNWDIKLSGRGPIPTLLFGAVLAFVLMISPQSPLAQTAADAATDYINRTTEILERCTQQVNETEDDRAHRILEAAWELQHRAEQLLGDSRYRGAVAASLRARETGKQAAQVARSASNFEERARLRMERAYEFHDALREQAIEHGNLPAERFLQEADRLLLKAREQFAQSHFEMSFNLVESAEGALRRAARLLFEGGGGDELERLLERTHHLIERVRDNLGENPDSEAAGILQRAEQSLRNAEAAFQQNRPLDTVQQARRARRLASMAGRMVVEGPQAEDVQRQIERFDERAALIGDRILEAENDIAGRRLAEAGGHRTQAAELLASGDMEGALRRIRVAHDLLASIEALLR